MTDADEVITLPVPEVVGAIYLIATDQPPDDLHGLIAARVEGRFDDALRHMVRDWNDAPGAPLQIRPVSEMPLPMELLIASGATDEQVERLSAATHVVLITAHTFPAGAPDHEHLARATALLVAEALSGDVIDILTYRMLTPDQASATLPDADGTTRLSDWVTVEYSADRYGYWCTTNGLRRFGLPELQTLTTPPNVVEQWGSAMTGIAGALLGFWSDALHRDRRAAFVQVPTLLRVSSDDVAAAYGQEPGIAASASVRITLDPRSPDRHSFLTVHPPLTWSGSAGEHIADVCATLFGARTSEVRRTVHGDAMDEAIAIARSSLVDIRERFESGKLDLHTKLLVKYAFPADEGTEYLWAYVTSWRDPYRILATSAADAVYHPTVRAGRPTVIDTATVVDWALEHDEVGVIEGGWTQAALDEV